MLTLEQAKEILDTISRQARMTRDEHSLAGQAIELLYSGAKEHQELQQEQAKLAHDLAKESSGE